MELSLEERVYGLSLIWKEAEYNFPFWKRLKGLDWDKAYREAPEDDRWDVVCDECGCFHRHSHL